MSGSFNLKDITGNYSGPDWDPDNLWYETAPQLMVRNGDGYDFYYFLNDGLDNGDGTYSPAWVDPGATPADIEIDAGTGFWIFDPFNATADYTISGQVPADSQIERTYPADFNLTANPYPVSFGVEDVIWGGITGPDWDPDNLWYETAPQLMVRNGDGYDFYYFLNDGLDNGDGTYSPAWVDPGATPVSGTLINGGDAFWFKPTGEVKVTYSIR